MKKGGKDQPKEEGKRVKGEGRLADRERGETPEPSRKPKGVGWRGVQFGEILLADRLKRLQHR